MTDKLFFDYFIKQLEREGQEVTDAERKALDIELGRKNGKYFVISSPKDDVENKKFRVVISINDKNIIDHIFIFKDHSNEILASTSCDIDEKGFITFKTYPKEEDEWKEHERIEQFYIIIKNIYHRHTHHKELDLLLRPVNAEDKDDAVGKIINQFNEKIIHYHQQIKKRLSLPNKDFITSIELITAAKGEMIYASSFVNLFFSGDEKNRQSHLFIFSNALESINVLSKEIELHYNVNSIKYNAQNHKLSQIMVVLTYIIVILTSLTLHVDLPSFLFPFLFSGCFIGLFYVIYLLKKTKEQE